MAERIEDRLKGMIVERLMLKARPEEIGDEDDLIKKWNVESVQLMEIVIGLEELFGIQLGDDEFSIKKFRTVKNIGEVVRAKKPEA
ncbi:MAG TPA: acyl carrier protein [Planctomycetota bacterium]|nr:acyl carrier protein [Planctomycetota bacterium]